MASLSRQNCIRNAVVSQVYYCPYEICACNPFRMNTCGTKDLRPLGINTYRKRWGQGCFSTTSSGFRLSTPRFAHQSPTSARTLARLGRDANLPPFESSDLPTFKRSKRFNLPPSSRKSFRMHSYEIAYALTLLESHSYRKTGGGGGLIVNQNQPSLPSPCILQNTRMIDMPPSPASEHRC